MQKHKPRFIFVLNYKFYAKCLGYFACLDVVYSNIFIKYFN